MNIKQELVDFLLFINKYKPDIKIKSADIHFIIKNKKGVFYNSKQNSHLLYKNHTSEEYKLFLNNLNFKESDDYKIQNVYGIVWLSDHSYLERDGYFGLNGWKRKYPNLRLP